MAMASNSVTSQKKELDFSFMEELRIEAEMKKASGINHHARVDGPSAHLPLPHRSSLPRYNPAAPFAAPRLTRPAILRNAIAALQEDLARLHDRYLVLGDTAGPRPIPRANADLGHVSTKAGIRLGVYLMQMFEDVLNTCQTRVDGMRELVQHDIDLIDDAFPALFPPARTNTNATDVPATTDEHYSQAPKVSMTPAAPLESDIRPARTSTLMHIARAIFPDESDVANHTADVPLGEIINGAVTTEQNGRAARSLASKYNVHGPTTSTPIKTQEHVWTSTPINPKGAPHFSPENPLQVPKRASKSSKSVTQAGPTTHTTSGNGAAAHTTTKAPAETKPSGPQWTMTKTTCTRQTESTGPAPPTAIRQARVPPIQAPAAPSVPLYQPVHSPNAPKGTHANGRSTGAPAHSEFNSLHLPYKTGMQTSPMRPPPPPTQPTSGIENRDAARTGVPATSVLVPIRNSRPLTSTTDSRSTHSREPIAARKEKTRSLEARTGGPPPTAHNPSAYAVPTMALGGSSRVAGQLRSGNNVHADGNPMVTAATRPAQVTENPGLVGGALARMQALAMELDGAAGVAEVREIKARYEGRRLLTHGRGLVQQEAVRGEVEGKRRSEEETLREIFGNIRHAGPLPREAKKKSIKLQPRPATRAIPLPAVNDDVFSSSNTSTGNLVFPNVLPLPARQSGHPPR